MRDFKHKDAWPLLRELHAKGDSTREIAKGMGNGWTKNMVIRQLRVLRLPSHNPPIAFGMNTWTEAEIEALRVARAKYTSWNPIAEATGRTVSACWNKCNTMASQGLPFAGPPITHGGRPQKKPKVVVVNAPRPILHRQSVPVYAAERRSRPTLEPDIHGVPGVWQMPVARTWEVIQEIAARSAYNVRTREDLVLFNKARVRQGYAPLVVARAASAKEAA